MPRHAKKTAVRVANLAQSVQMYANVPIAKTVMKIPSTRLIRILTSFTIVTAQVIASSKAINKKYVYPYLEKLAPSRGLISLNDKPSIIVIEILYIPFHHSKALFGHQLKRLGCNLQN